MAVTTIPIGVGLAAGDGLGDKARTGGQSYNTSIANLDAATELLQSRGFEIDNTSATLVLGERIISEVHAGITKTLPASPAAISATGYNDIWILNTDANANVTVTPQAGEAIYIAGVSQGAGTSYVLRFGFMAICFSGGAAGAWHLLEIPIGNITSAYIDALDLTSQTTGDVLYSAAGSEMAPTSKEDADIVDRLIPAIETTPYLKHETRSARSSGTETINCEDDPSVYLPITGNSVTIALTVPTLSLPVRGLSDVRLNGAVDVLISGGAWTGLTVTTNAGTSIAGFPKGTAPNVSGERATLVWRWFDDGVTDLMWAEWILEA